MDLHREGICVDTSPILTATNSGEFGSGSQRPEEYTTEGDDDKDQEEEEEEAGGFTSGEFGSGSQRPSPSSHRHGIYTTATSPLPSQRQECPAPAPSALNLNEPAASAYYLLQLRVQRQSTDSTRLRLRVNTAPHLIQECRLICHPRLILIVVVHYGCGNMHANMVILGCVQ